MGFDIPVKETPPLQLGGAPVQQPMVQQPVAQPQMPMQPTGQPGFGSPMQQPMQPMGQPVAPQVQQPVPQMPVQQPAVQPQIQQPASQMAPQVPHPAATGVSLRKGQKQSLTKMNPNLDLIDIGLGWDTSNTSGVPYDLDCEAFMLGANDRIVGDEWFVFYNQPASPDGSVRHGGDNRTGQGSGDDEVIHVRLSQVAPQVNKIVIIITINEAIQRGHNFGGVSNAYVRIVDTATSKELVRFNLTDYYANVNSMVVGELYRHNGEWKFNPVGDGTSDDLMGLCRRYGVNVTD